MIDEVGLAAGGADSVASARSPSSAKAARRAEEQENSLAAGRFWERALHLMDPAPDEVRWEALLGRARARDAFRLLHEARDDALIVLEEATELGSDAWQSQAHVTLGRVEADAGNYDQAEQHYARAVTLLRALGDASGVADALRGLGVSGCSRAGSRRPSGSSPIRSRRSWPRATSAVRPGPSRTWP